jgi:hypothetical protein
VLAIPDSESENVRRPLTAYVPVVLVDDVDVVLFTRRLPLPDGTLVSTMITTSVDDTSPNAFVPVTTYL